MVLGGFLVNVNGCALGRSSIMRPEPLMTTCLHRSWNSGSLQSATSQPERKECPCHRRPPPPGTKYQFKIIVIFGCHTGRAALLPVVSSPALRRVGCLASHPAMFAKTSHLFSIWYLTHFVDKYHEAVETLVASLSTTPGTHQRNLGAHVRKYCGALEHADARGQRRIWFDSQEDLSPP
jgi:hypothetical protein